MISPFSLPPHPLAQSAAAEVIKRMHAYMDTHPESELHRQGKMFGVLVYKPHTPYTLHATLYLAAFSAKLDGSYHHEGFVPPVYEMRTPPIGTSRDESKRLQRLLFANYNFLNAAGQSKNLLELFADTPPVLPPEAFFNHSKDTSKPLPPSGAGECCAPKLLQYAFAHSMEPIALAEFWIGAPPHTEIRQEGVFYPPCSGKCVPILRHMLSGIEITGAEEIVRTQELCRQIEILYEDEFLIVINKPSGLLSVPGKNEDNSVISYLSSQYNYAYLQAAHRLDQDTSGLLVLAKDPEIYRTLQSYFQRRDILKRYEALVLPNTESGIYYHPSSIINLPLLPNPYDRPRQMVDHEHGKPSITRYTIRESRPDGSFFIDFYPLTGRTHQLRVHAAHPDGLNAPILGDRLYGNLSSADRMYLHAAEIYFLHPKTQKEMHFCIPSCF